MNDWTNIINSAGLFQQPQSISNPLGSYNPLQGIANNIDVNKAGTVIGGANPSAGKGFNLDSLKGAALGTINPLISSLINPSGNTTGVGNTMKQIGNLATNIPGVGGVIGAGLANVGTFVNTLFGSNINEGNVNRFRQQALQQGNYIPSAVDNSSLLSEYDKFRELGAVKKNDVGSDGWFSNKASNLTRNINRQRRRANERALASLGNVANNIEQQQDSARTAQYLADGGSLNNNLQGITEFNTGGTHEQNPLGGIPQGINNQGNLNLVEQGEIRFNDFIFSNRIKDPRTNKTFAKTAKNIMKESEERPNDSISKNYLNKALENLQRIQETVQQEQQIPHEQNPNTQTFVNGGNLASNLRYAPIVGSGIQVLSDILGKTNQPQYDAAERIEQAARDVEGAYTPIGYTPIGERMTYTPTDTRQSIADLQSLSMAGLSKTTGNPLADRATRLATIYNTQRAMGDVLKQSTLADITKRAQVLGFNRATDQNNAQMAMYAANSNAANRMRATQAAARLKAQAAGLRDQAYRVSDVARAANLSNLFTNLGALGKEESTKNLISKLAKKGVFKYDALGNFIQNK